MMANKYNIVYAKIRLLSAICIVIVAQQSPLTHSISNSANQNSLPGVWRAPEASGNVPPIIDGRGLTITNLPNQNISPESGRVVLIPIANIPTTMNQNGLTVSNLPNQNVLQQSGGAAIPGSSMPVIIDTRGLPVAIQRSDESVPTVNAVPASRLIPPEDIAPQFPPIQNKPYLVYRIKRDRVMKTSITFAEKFVDEDECKINFFGCCKEQVYLNLRNNNYQQFKRECVSELERTNENDKMAHSFTCNQLDVTMKHLICLHECIYRKLQLAENNGSLIESKLKVHVKMEMCKYDWQKSIADNVTAQCLLETGNFKNKRGGNGEDQSGDTSEEFFSSQNECNASALKFTLCTLRIFNEMCPKSLQLTKNGKCTTKLTPMKLATSSLESQSDESEQTDFISSRVPPRDHIIFGDI